MTMENEAVMPPKELTRLPEARLDELVLQWAIDYPDGGNATGLSEPLLDSQLAWNLAEHWKIVDAKDKEYAELRTAAEAAMYHLAELVDAWQRGAIHELDNKGGTRSNKNMEIFLALDKAFKALPEAQHDPR